LHLAINIYFANEAEVHVKSFFEPQAHEERGKKKEAFSLRASCDLLC